jgi:hypothetical protein
MKTRRILGTISLSELVHKSGLGARAVKKEAWMSDDMKEGPTLSSQDEIAGRFRTGSDQRKALI